MPERVSEYSLLPDLLLMRELHVGMNEFIAFCAALTAIQSFFSKISSNVVLLRGMTFLAKTYAKYYKMY